MKLNKHHDKEKLFEDRQRLKKMVNQLKDENLKLKTKVQGMIFDNKKYENIFLEGEDGFQENKKKKKSDVTPPHITNPFTELPHNQAQKTDQRSEKRDPAR